MPLVFACVAPHGGRLLLSPEEGCPVPLVREAMRELGRRITALDIDLLVIVTPHGQLYQDAVTLSFCATAAGSTDGGEIETAVDIDFAAEWRLFAQAFNVPIIGLIGENPSDPFPLDWGVTIPYAFFSTRELPIPIVVACPDRALPRETLVRCGEALAMAAEQSDKRIALVASADQGHGHSEFGPYGLSTTSKDYDLRMQSAIERDALIELMDWDESWVESALPDSLWQTLFILGAQRHVTLVPEFLAYEVDDYFGMLCAAFQMA